MKRHNKWEGAKITPRTIWRWGLANEGSNHRFAKGYKIIPVLELALVCAYLVYEGQEGGTRAQIRVEIQRDEGGYAFRTTNDRGLDLRFWTDGSYRLLKLVKFQDGKEKTYEEWVGNGYRVRMWGVERHMGSSEPICDRHTIPFYIRGWDMAGLTERDLRVLVPELAIITVGIRKLGEETVEVPAGTFACYKLELHGKGITTLVLMGKKFWLWYEKAEPHRLVMYSDSDGRVVRLVESGGF